MRKLNQESKSLFLSYGLLITALLLLATGPAQAASMSKNNLLQFTSGGHVLGFAPNKVLVAGTDHAWQVSFVDARQVSPQAAGMHKKEVKGAPPLSRVTYENLWAGVTLAYEGKRGIFESTYTIAPHDPGQKPVDQIRLRYNLPVSLDDAGNLVLAFEKGRMKESSPVAWQVKNGRRLPVKTAFRLLVDREVGFRVGAYDPALPLFIDPVLTWHTFLGGTDWDEAHAIAVDAAGNIYLAGTSTVTWGAPINTPTRGNHAFVAKLDSGGNLIWHTFLGGILQDSGDAIAVDVAGNIYLAGTSSATWGAPLNNHAGREDAFVAKIDSNGGLVWNTFLGSANFDYGRAISTDAAGHIYLAGVSGATWGAPLNHHNGPMDAFVARLDNNGGLVWHTFLGGTGYNNGNAIALDAVSNICIAGDNGGDAFVAKLNSNDGSLAWRTFLGGSDMDKGNAIALDADGNIYLAGNSYATWGAPINAHAGREDAFVARLDSDGGLIWNTFLGSADSEEGRAIAVNAAGNIYLAGYSYATWGAPINAHAGNRDAFVARLDSDGGLILHTFLGSADRDYGSGITADAAGNIYLAGASNSWGSNPTRPHTGGGDAFVAKLLPTPHHRLTVYPTGSGSGRVASSPAGIDCGADCYEWFLPGTNVTLTAEPGAGMLFGGWSASGFGQTGDCTVTMDGDRTITAIFSDPFIDSDLDGISDWDEQGPSPGIHDYDGNGDGLIDWLQPHVISGPDFGGEKYITAAFGGVGVTRAVCVAVDTPAASPPADLAFDYGFYQNTITCIPGGKATATLYLAAGDTPISYYKYGPTPDNPAPHWYEFLYDAASGTGAEIDGNVITLHFVDGARGDDDLDANGIISDPGGPAFAGGGEQNTSSGGGGGCFITAVNGDP